MLDYCTECGSLEQGWRPVTLQEVLDAGGEAADYVDPDDQTMEDNVCT
jgi:hypothetical protein